jgi:hypothetical protein
MKGKEHVFSKLQAYNSAARHRPWFTLVDLDAWDQCIPAFVSTRLPLSSPGMRFRVAVHTVEAWLLADAVRLADFLAVPPSRLPADPDAVARPKHLVVDLARHSRSGAIRRDMAPREGSGAVVGPLYAPRLREFASTSWDPGGSRPSGRRAWRAASGPSSR